MNSRVLHLELETTRDFEWVQTRPCFGAFRPSSINQHRQGQPHHEIQDAGEVVIQGNFDMNRRFDVSPGQASREAKFVERPLAQVPCFCEDESPREAGGELPCLITEEKLSRIVKQRVHVRTFGGNPDGRSSS